MSEKPKTLLVTLYRAGGKRALDFVIASLALAFLSPLLLLIALLVKIKIGSPILFRQIRPGWKGRLFEVIKFRTMTEERDTNGQLLTDAERLTSFGQLLRSTSVDELPELWNICKGEMSLVGPRPLMVEYLPLYSEEQSRRHQVRPGLTGWSQVNGRNSISWPQKLALDTWYSSHVSFGLDLRIIGLTLRQVISRHGISHAGDATMPRFTGTETEAHDVDCQP